METIGVREFKNKATQVVRAVRENHAEYIITVDGAPVAVLSPFDDDARERMRQSDIEAHLAWMDHMSELISAAWTGTETAVEAVERQRRSL